jgi:hypothetical protein
MDSIYSIVHITTEKNYKKIMEDGYLRPYRSVHGTGVFCFIQKKKDHWKKIPNFQLFGKFVIQLDKKILLERSDYIIRNSMMDPWEVFGGPVIYNAKNDKDKKKFNKAILKLTNLNEIRFDNKISLKKYMMSAFTKKIPQSGGAWGKNADVILSAWQSPREIQTDIGIVIFDDPSIGRSSNAKIFMGTLEDKELHDIAVKLQKNDDNAVDEGNLSMEISGLPGIPKYFTHGICGPEQKFYYIVMERLGSTFGSSENILVKVFDLQKLKMLVGNYSIQLIDGMESLYNCHYYHIDLWLTSNILFGIGENSNKLYLIDFCNITQTKKEYEENNNKFNEICKGNIYNALEFMILSYGLGQYTKFFKYSIITIKSTIDFIIKSILLNDREPPKFQALRDMFSRIAEDIILPLQTDNNIYKFAIENKIIEDEIIQLLSKEIEAKK